MCSGWVGRPAFTPPVASAVFVTLVKNLVISHEREMNDGVVTMTNRTCLRSSVSQIMVNQ
jgi:hypothetical protein